MSKTTLKAEAETALVNAARIYSAARVRVALADGALDTSRLIYRDTPSGSPFLSERRDEFIRCINERKSAVVAKGKAEPEFMDAADALALILMDEGEVEKALPNRGVAGLTATVYVDESVMTSPADAKLERLYNSWADAREAADLADAVAVKADEESSAASDKSFNAAQAYADALVTNVCKEIAEELGLLDDDGEDKDETPACQCGEAIEPACQCEAEAQDERPQIGFSVTVPEGVVLTEEQVNALMVRASALLRNSL